MNHSKPMAAKYLFGCFLLLFFTSCRELVQDNFPDFEPAPAVHCILQEGEPLKLRLSWAAKLDTSRIRFIEDAAVRLFVNGEYVETIAHQGDGLYVATSGLVASSQRYKCEISVPGCATIIASDSLPAAVAPAHIQYIPVAVHDEEGLPCPAVRFTIASQRNQKRYYQAVIWKIREHYGYETDPVTGQITNVLTETEMQEAYPGPITDPVLKAEGLPVFIFSNELMQGDQCTITLNYFEGSYTRTDNGRWIPDADPVILELRSISRDYYLYARQKYLYETGFTPEFGRSATVFPLYSNIRNAYGIFAGYAAARSDTLNIHTNTAAISKP
jgi:hypothetical protein